MKVRVEINEDMLEECTCGSQIIGNITEVFGGGGHKTQSEEPVQAKASKHASVTRLTLANN